MRILVAGAGGFIGGHLCKKLGELGHTVIAVSSRPVEQWAYSGSAIRLSLDLREKESCDFAASLGIDEAYNLAAKVGGIGYINANRSECAMSVLINTHLLQACAANKVQRYFFASSACVYPSREGFIREEDAWPAQPSAGYGLEKLFSEEMCQYLDYEGKIKTRVGRFFTTYGPGDDIKGKENKDHVPAALCRKIILAKRNGDRNIDVWGDGTQKRNFLHVSDAVEGAIRLMKSEYRYPVNIGSDRQVSINQLLDMIEKVAGTNFGRQYTFADTGVHARNSDNTCIRKVLDWEPGYPLEAGIQELYCYMASRI